MDMLPMPRFLPTSSPNRLPSLDSRVVTISGPMACRSTSVHFYILAASVSKLDPTGSMLGGHH